MRTSFTFILFLFFSFSYSFSKAQQQYNVEGKVVDYSNRRPLEAVSVFTTSGKTLITDSLGKFTVPVKSGDSIWFSYFGKRTQKYPVDTIANPYSFEVGLHIDVAWLPAVKVRSSDYRSDSILNRQNYAKAFDYKKPGIAISSNPPSSYVPGSVTSAFDLDALIDVFRYKKKRQMASLQNRLLFEEQDKYVLHRFSKRLIKQLTNLDGKSLDSFIMIYKPPYDVMLAMNDIELGYYIQQCYYQFRHIQPTKSEKPDVFIRKPEEEEP
ncbi:hypothetical protein QTN47_16645 [Danxiaibacter flavus]|uniref:Carboxypeptidase-like regulatory domain-containing protein n=1 Tax=Danxiaibacter flavus TaxID=3049108 RepID=A0ABV3ZHZ2_9BACT|nr:hypothetical protein QNM32_16655 [Chitinophagaceae bacterium DXS]